MTGVKLSTAATSAVNREHVDSLAARVDELEKDDEFSGAAAVSLSLTLMQSGGGAHGPGNIVKMNFRMEPTTDEDSVKRYEIYWTEGH